MMKALEPKDEDPSNSLWHPEAGVGNSPRCLLDEARDQEGTMFSEVQCPNISQDYVH